MICFFFIFFFFFFSSRRRHTRLQGDWSSDVCSSDLLDRGLPLLDLRLGDGEGVLPLVVLQLRDRLRLDETGGPVDLDSREVEHRLRLSDRAQRGGELSLERPRIDREEKLPLAEVGAVGEVDLQD